MVKVKKRKSKKFRLLVDDLRYWQSRYRIESNGILKTKEKIKTVAEMMRHESNK